MEDTKVRRKIFNKVHVVDQVNPVMYMMLILIEMGAPVAIDRQSMFDTSDFKDSEIVFYEEVKMHITPVGHTVFEWLEEAS